MENTNLTEHKYRLDVEMERRGLARSRSSAADLIKRGKVIVNGSPAVKASREVSENDRIEISGRSFVSRAGEKLSHALEIWDLDVSGLSALDIGSSTGGFVDCLLQKGASKVIAVDVGTNQLDKKLLEDARVEVHEGTDIRDFTLDAPADFVVVDVSFISLSHILPKAYELLRMGGQSIALVKPQFEVGKEVADKYKGVIADPIEQRGAVDNVIRYAEKAGFEVLGETPSPIEGEKGNKEFLLRLRKP